MKIAVLKLKDIFKSHFVVAFESVSDNPMIDLSERCIFYRYKIVYHTFLLSKDS
jgi:hypothetical protein